MFRHWVRFAQLIGAGLAIMLAAQVGLSGESPDSPSPPTDGSQTTPDTPAEKPAAPASADVRADAAKEEPKAEPKEEPKPEPKDTAQEQPQPATDGASMAGSNAEPQAEPKAEAKAEPPSAPAPGAQQPEASSEDPAAVFAARFAEWKDTLKELRSLRIDFRTATPDKADEIRAKWTDAVARAEALIKPLAEAGKAAYVAAPNANPELTELLVKVVADEVKHDDYEPAIDVARALLDHGCTKKELYDPAAIAAFATNDFDAAQTWGQRAQTEGTLSETGGNFLSQIPAYKKLWADEQKIRAKEAEQDDLPQVRLTTNKGDIVVELLENEAPETVGNFVSLVEQKFYDGLTFHRVLPGFMAQGGCPRGDGTGDPGYKIYCECTKDNHRNHFRGSLSMAHAGRNTGGSQFFITFVPTPHLNGQHTVFGRVIEGLDVLAKLQRNDPEAKGDAPIADKIIKAEVIRKRDHQYKPHKVE